MPSTRTPSKPYAWAFCASVAEAVCLATGTEIAHWLLLHRKTVGVRKTPAKFMAAWKSDVLVARSEEHTSELQSQSNLVCRLLLEKKKKRNRYSSIIVI